MDFNAFVRHASIAFDRDAFHAFVLESKGTTEGSGVNEWWDLWTAYCNAQDVRDLRTTQVQALELPGA